jgi:hypothetical protein
VGVLAVIVENAFLRGEAYLFFEPWRFLLFCALSALFLIPKN